MFPFEFDRSQSAPIYRQLYQRFCASIADGRLRSGDRVPAVRALAAPPNAAEGVGHEGAAAFVRDQERRDPCGAGQFVVQLRVVHAGDAEGVRDAELLQRKNGELGGGLVHGGPRGWVGIEAIIARAARCAE